MSHPRPDGQKSWEDVIRMPIPGRSSKPRSHGLTMVIDKGLGLHALEDLLDTAGDYVDILKLTFGTSAFYDRKLLRKKNEKLRERDVEAMPGGTFLEVAVWQGVVRDYLVRARELGFSALEVSDGTIDIRPDVRADLIRRAREAGFRVLTEVGKKDPREALAMDVQHRQIAEDLRNGASQVIIEAREAGRGVGIFDQDGKTRLDEVEAVIAGVSDPSRLVWEAPLKNQQQDLILRFGPNVNLGNVPPEEVLALEALRQGVRGDTLKRAYLGSLASSGPA